MNKLASAVATLAIVLTMNSAKAGGTDEAPKTSNSNAIKMEMLKKELNKELSRNVVYPYLETEHDMHGTALATFVVDKTGKLEVLEVRSTNEHLASYIKEKLAKVDLEDNNDGIWRKTTVRFVFRKEA